MISANIVVTGVGILSAAGLDAGAVWESIRNKRTVLGVLGGLESPRWAGQPIGEIHADLDKLGAPRAGSRSAKLAGLAIGQAVDQAGWDREAEAELATTGLVLGATTGGVRGSEAALAEWMRHGGKKLGELKWHECASSTDLCARRLGLGGPTTTLSTACSSGALAIAAAAELIAAGDARRMIAVGVDSLALLTINGFNSLLLVDPEGCRPFDADRAGMNLGEGAAALALELEADARARGAKILARLEGWGATCDAHHATAPHPEGAGAAGAMRQALDSAGIEPRAIDYINAHGTGTPDNERAESKALRAVFGSRVPAFSSTKGFFGHTLAASGALEAVVSILAINNGELPPNAGFHREDHELGLSPLTELTPCAAKTVMSNSFGFGGNNAALIFGAPESNAPIAAAYEKTRDKRAEEFVVAGIGLVSPAGHSAEALYAAARSGGIAPIRCEGDESLGTATTLGYACADLPDKEELPAGKRRRLNRLLKMSVIAARRARRGAGEPGAKDTRTALCLGTGLGCLTDTMDFLCNMIAEDERAPKPAKFINSVHNAPAGQAALELEARGLNSAPTHCEISFETALWQAMAELRSGRADAAYAGAADELSPYLVGVGCARAWWPNKPEPVRPFGKMAPDQREPIAGEAAAVHAITRAGDTETPLARVSACRIGRWKRAGTGGIDAQAEARWIEAELERDGIALKDIDLILTGANGSAKLDAMHRSAHSKIEERAGRAIALAGYKHLCGEFGAASAVGFALAVGLVRGEIGSGDLVRGSDAISGEPVRTVLLQTLSPEGSRAITCIRSLKS